LTRNDGDEELPHDLELEVVTSYGIDEGGNFTPSYGLKVGATENE
jgi:hypothetical protein